MVELVPELREQLSGYNTDQLEQAEIQMKYAGYIEKEVAMADKMKKLEQLPLPSNFDYDRVNALSNEGRQKLKQVQPGTLGQASRISGVRQSDISVLMVYLGR